MDNISKFKEIFVVLSMGVLRYANVLFAASKEMNMTIIVLICVGNYGSTEVLF